MKKIGLMACAAMMCLFSCQKNEQSEQYIINDSEVLYASMEDEQSSRTSIGELNSIVWSEGDCIISFMKKTKGCKYRIKTESVGLKAAEFTKVGLDMGESDVLAHNVAYYPYDAAVVCEASADGASYLMSVTLPDVQQYVDGNFAVNAFPMSAVSDDENLTFNNICGLLKLQLKGVQKVASIKIQGNSGEKLSGAGVVATYLDGVPSITMDAAAKTTATLKCSPAVQLSESNAVDFYIVLPPVVFADGFTVTIVDSDANEVVLKSAKQTTMSRSTVLKMPEVTLPAPEEPESTGDLAAAGTANSYIVQNVGTYYFPTVKGNTDISVGEVASAAVLWESFGTSDYVSVGSVVTNVSYANGVITFDTAKKFKYGNAVIGAKDKDGNILWSWHIWVTDYPAAHVYNNEAGVMMDRNLGATAAYPGSVEALGLLYQWGRKDPFLNSSSVSDVRNPYSSITWPDPVETDAEIGTVEYTILHPTTFLTAAAKYPYDWHFNSTDNSLWSSQKTMYDPCPAGWRVPDGGSKTIWKLSGYSGLEFSAEEYGFEFPISDSATSWYPASGFISYEGVLSMQGEYGFYWTVTPESTWACCMSLALEGFRPNAMNDRSFAYSVRCCQISE